LQAGIHFKEREDIGRNRCRKVADRISGLSLKRDGRRGCAWNSIYTTLRDIGCESNGTDRSVKGPRLANWFRSTCMNRNQAKPWLGIV
jgi:hypothetical protein